MRMPTADVEVPVVWWLSSRLDSRSDSTKSGHYIVVKVFESSSISTSWTLDLSLSVGGMLSSWRLREGVHWSVCHQIKSLFGLTQDFILSCSLCTIAVYFEQSQVEEFTHLTFNVIYISRVRNAPYLPHTNALSRSLMWIWKKIIPYYLRTLFFPIDVNFGGICRDQAPVRCGSGQVLYAESH